MFCGGEIPQSARFCGGCGKPVGFWSRIRAGLRTAIEIISFISTAVAIVFLLFSTQQTGEQLRIQREAYENERLSSKLQDSATRQQLDLLINQLEETKTANALQKRAIEVDSQKMAAEKKRVLEERRPRLVVERVDCTWDSVAAKYTAHLNLTNYGEATATRSVLYVSISWYGSDSSWNDTIRLGDVLRDLPRVLPVVLPGDAQHQQSLIGTKVSYSWKEYELPFQEEKYFHVGSDNNTHKRSCKSISAEEFLRLR
ncbi:MAG: zinc ribbon domain-containing protein [candidate division Zixibacteria bacterium]|nr:zinc ribbon domain-containing protein [candidate division Zixibacteria bacterium]